jgi:AcrR family transcriptional regulator
MQSRRLTRQESRLVTRAALVKAAEEVFLNEGFEHASVERITEAAGFSRGAFYSNFRDKEELALAVIEKRCQELAQALRKLHRISDSIERRAAIRVWFLKQCRETAWIALRLEFNRRARGKPQVARWLAELCRQEIRTCADPLVQEYTSGSVSAEIPAVALLAVCHGLGSMGLEFEPELDRLRDAAATLVLERLLSAESRMED